MACSLILDLHDGWTRFNKKTYVIDVNGNLYNRTKLYNFFIQNNMKNPEMIYNKIHPEFASTPQEIIVFEKIMWQKVTLILMKNVLLVPTYD